MPISRDPHDPVYNPAVPPLAEPVEPDLERLSLESPAKQGKETYVLRPCAQGNVDAIDGFANGAGMKRLKPNSSRLLSLLSPLCSSRSSRPGATWR